MIGAAEVKGGLYAMCVATRFSVGRPALRLRERRTRFLPLPIGLESPLLVPDKNSTCSYVSLAAIGKSRLRSSGSKINWLISLI
ncbi:hypothetical protein Lal_00014673 [Lupinus albus]|nr:hypothetical protein Lal_00014673 [Lupinus albus]